LKQLLLNAELARSDILVLGAGISGLTTAIVLQSLGFEPVIVGEHVVHPGAVLPPSVASAYPMASAYPHNLLIRDLEQITDWSQEVFEYLEPIKGTGVFKYTMFEVFEQEPAPAPLACKRMKFETFAGTPSAVRKSVNAPVRKGADYIFGWRFDTFFADMPLYLDYLWNLYKSNGGIVHTAVLEGPASGRLLQSGADQPVVNCLGSGAMSAFSDAAPAVIMRGSQVLVPGAPLVVLQDRPAAYNYTPTAEVYSRGDGDPEYVHFFPRSDGWILGQTREPGFLDANGQWQGTAVLGPRRVIGQIAVPEQIIALNDELLQSWVGQKLGARELTARQGYRYYRDPSGSGVRLSAETLDGLVIHNYGHGGSGVTVSWGCAVECSRLLKKHGVRPERKRVTRGDLSRLLQVMVE
jgi:D-amino-acid oxidase